MEIEERSQRAWTRSHPGEPILEPPLARPPLALRADWDRLFAVSVHATQVEILAAMEWLDFPVSPVQLTAVLDKQHKGIGHVGYHVRKLHEYRLLRLKSTRPVRGATEHFYLLAS